jgi:chromosome segregation ATPase
LYRFNLQVEVSKLSDILKSLQDQIENEKEQNKILASKLLESTKNAESLETARLELEDNLEKLKLEAQTHLERLSSLTEELRLKAIELDETRDKLSRSDLEIETRAEELTNVSREVESLRKCLSDSETKHCEIVKELQLSHDREKAQKGLKDQMISYQKELQEQIRYDKHYILEIQTYVPTQKYFCRTMENFREGLLFVLGLKFHRSIELVLMLKTKL